MAQPGRWRKWYRVLYPYRNSLPFPLTWLQNNFYYRQDVRKTESVYSSIWKLGHGNSNSEPMQNVRNNIWHCDKDGKYQVGNFTGITGTRKDLFARLLYWCHWEAQLWRFSQAGKWTVCPSIFKCMLAPVMQLSLNDLILKKQTNLYTEHKDIYTSKLTCSPLTGWYFLRWTEYRGSYQVRINQNNNI